MEITAGLKLKVRQLAALLLREAADEFSKKGCGDFDLRDADFSIREAKALVTYFHQENGDPEELENINSWTTDLPDWCLMHICADLLEEM